MKPLFITGIGTDVGKTITAAVLVEKLQADYWKPVQSGDLENTDTDKLKALISNTKTCFHPEGYRLTQPFSPHKSATLDGITIDIRAFELPETNNQLIIEGAGGLLVPLSNRHYVMGLIEQFEAEVILVIKHYLGSINHTLLSLALLKSRNIPVKGIIFNGQPDSFSEEAILDFNNPVLLGRIPFIDTLSKQSIIALGEEINLDHSRSS